MSKHYKQLKKLNKRALGLSTTDINSEIQSVNKRRDNLSTLLYNQSQKVIGAKVIADMVDNYHLKSVGAADEINTSLSARCENVDVINTYKKNVSTFFDSRFKVGELTQISSTILLYTQFLTYVEKYANDNLTLYIEKLLESGKLKLVLKEDGGKKEESPFPTNLTEQSLKEVNKIVLDYLPTYEKIFIEFLPTYMDYKGSLQKIKDSYGEFLTKGNSTIKKTVWILKTVENFGGRTKLQQVETVTLLESNIRKYKISIGELNVSAKNIILNNGSPNLETEKENLSSLEKENGSIDITITSLVNEKEEISQSKIKKDESVKELGELLGSVDTTFIDKNSLISLTTAAETHKTTLKVYSGERIGKIIEQAAKEGKFFVEIFELTDIEAKIVLDKGYELLESTESIVHDPNNLGHGRKTEILTTWTISWENATNINEEEG
jgi:hypothetical protein